MSITHDPIFTPVEGDLETVDIASTNKDALEELFTCGICKAFSLDVHFTGCRNQHVACGSCLLRQFQVRDTCPFCREVGVSEHSAPARFAQTLASAVGRKCRWAEHGCEEIIPMNSTHEATCNFHGMTCDRCGLVVPLCHTIPHKARCEWISCGFPGCTAKLSLETMIEHDEAHYTEEEKKKKAKAEREFKAQRAAFQRKVRDRKKRMEVLERDQKKREAIVIE